MIHLTFSLLGLFYSLAECQLQNATLPIRLPRTALTNSSTCPLLNDSAQREVVRKTLDSHYSSDNRPCSCGYARSWTRAIYLNMSDPNQQCPSNWTLITTPIRGCGRRDINAYTCDSVTYSVHNRTYSSVCGRILAYQRGYSSALYTALLTYRNTIEASYLSGLSLTHGPAGSRQHIWSFVGAQYEQSQSYSTYFTCPCTNTNAPWTHQVPSMITSVTLGIMDLALSLLGTTLMTHYGMARDVAVQAPAVSSTHPLGSASLYPSLQVMTWR